MLVAELYRRSRRKHQHLVLVDVWIILENACYERGVNVFPVALACSQQNFRLGAEGYLSHSHDETHRYFQMPYAAVVEKVFDLGPNSLLGLGDCSELLQWYT